MRQKRDLAEHVWYGVETSVNVGEPLFRLDWTTVIFGRVLLDAKERFDCDMRGLALSGRDRWFQRGGFFAAAPWRGVQATPQAQQKVVPVSGASIGGVKATARKELAGFIPYKLSCGCPRWTGIGEKAGDAPRCAFSVSSRWRKKRKPAPSAEKTAL